VFMVYDVVDHRDPSSHPTAAMFWAVVAPLLLALIVFEVLHMAPSVVLFFQFPSDTAWSSRRRRRWVYFTAHAALWLVVMAVGGALVLVALWHYQRDIGSHVRDCNTCGAPAFLRYGEVGNVAGTQEEVTHGLCRSACPDDPLVYDYTLVDAASTMCRNVRSYECCSDVTAIYSLGEHCEMRMAIIRVALLYFLAYGGGAALIEVIHIATDPLRNPVPEPDTSTDSSVDITTLVSIDENTGLLDIEDHNTTLGEAGGP